MADERSIRRKDLPAVVRRAAELASIDDDVTEELPEEEVVRIASELGLPERYVRQALFEGVVDEGEPSFLDRQFGTPRVVAGRAVPFDAERAKRLIEDYFVACEYLQVVRRQGNSMTFEPAVDTVSKMARAFKRSSKHQLAAAYGLEVSVRPLEPGWSHVRIRAVFEDNRKSQLVGGAVMGSLVGLPVSALTTVITGGLLNGLLMAEAAVALGGIAGIAAFSSIVTASLASIRRQWRRWRQRTQDQAEGVLDRLERGDDLRPPPSPWMRKLQMKFGQS